MGSCYQGICIDNVALGASFVYRLEIAQSTDSRNYDLPSAKDLPTGKFWTFGTEMEQPKIEVKLRRKLRQNNMQAYDLLCHLNIVV
jgi:hypothetical protein